MLKNIKLHLLKDESQQSELEKSASLLIQKNKSENINAFQRNIPSIAPLIEHFKPQNLSIFCNKNGELNIVDLGLGRTIYGFNPEKEIKQQVELFMAKPTLVCLGSKSPIVKSPNHVLDDLSSSPQYIKHIQARPLPERVDCMVMLGCGIGYHILELLRDVEIKHLIIYEPELHYFYCSVLAINWREIFDIAKRKETALYLQIGKDGRDLVADVEQLSSLTDINEFYVYQHYRHPVFNSIKNEVALKSWKEILENGISFQLEERYFDYTPPWNQPQNIQLCSAKESRQHIFEKNILALKRYFPNLYKDFKDYRPQNWAPVVLPNGDVNIVHINSLTFWYGESPFEECQIQYQHFHGQPNKDGIVLGYTGKKLAHYLHYRFVRETESLLAEIEEEQGSLTEEIESIIVFGMGAGYQVNSLVTHHKIENLFVCEPNRDFFFASLYALDWHDILTTVDKRKHRIYLNIGDDGSHLMKDLLCQFYSIGTDVLSNTYFYQGYHNSILSNAIAQLREQLKIVISMGEYFDHAYYGIAHTVDSIKKNFPYLASKPDSRVDYNSKEVPIFLIGNGPSLDHSLSTIKEWQNKAIVISCGTSLQVLHKNGIKPDFHAEIEQNRSTYYWSSIIGDFEYLKAITLISCNGIHPDTCELFKDVLITFKEGESSTVSTLNILGEEQFEVLKFAFPTVTNFATNLFTTLGFKNIYFIGVDLGFIDNKKHHSVQSAYYKDNQKETFDYAAEQNTSIVVEGNFRPTVFTKLEFKIAKQLMEQTILNKDRETNYFNCSNGAKIFGTSSLALDDILITTSTTDKHQAIRSVINSAFQRVNGSEFVKQFNEKYSSEFITKELKKLKAEYHTQRESIKSFRKHVKDIRDFLFVSYEGGRSLLFYYLYGTLNYTNSVLSTLVNSGGDEASKIKNANHLMRIAHDYFTQMAQLISRKDWEFDSTFPNVDIGKTISKVTAHALKDKSVLVITNSLAFKKSFEWLSVEKSEWSETKVYYKPANSTLTESQLSHIDYLLLFNDPRISCERISLPEKHLTDSTTVLEVILGHSRNIKPSKSITHSKLILPHDPNSEIIRSDIPWYVHLAMLALPYAGSYPLLTPRLLINENASVREGETFINAWKGIIREFGDARVHSVFIGIGTQRTVLGNLHLEALRGKPCNENNKFEGLVLYCEETQQAKKAELYQKYVFKNSTEPRAQLETLKFLNPIS